jgi:hypothetical protein
MQRRISGRLYRASPAGSMAIVAMTVLLGCASSARVGGDLQDGFCDAGGCAEAGDTVDSSEGSDGASSAISYVADAGVADRPDAPASPASDASSDAAPDAAADSSPDGSSSPGTGSSPEAGPSPDASSSDSGTSGAAAVLYATTSATASSSISNWPTSNAFDGSPSTSWSSSLHTTPAASEWLAFWWSTGLAPTNYVKLRPRYSGNTALCFPVDFTLNYSDGSKWVQAATYSGFPAPSRGDWIVLPLPSTVTANGIQVVASKLGSDGSGNDALQVAEVAAGYDPGFDQLAFVNNNVSALPGKTQIAGVGVNAFDPSRLSHWDYDDRGPVITPGSGAYRNIYAPQAIATGSGSWNVYFGGWDGSATGNDQISMTTTSDAFGTFGAHVLDIGHGSYTHCNNDSVLRLGASSWWMVYTTYPDGTVNKPAYATSTDGVHWSPSSGSASYLLSMSGYANWTNADVNGGNTIYKDASGTWHLYFVDFSSGSAGGVLHATSSDGVNYAYQGQVLANGVVPQDMKAFAHAATTYYVGAYHANGHAVWSTVSTSPTSPGSLVQLIANEGNADQYIVAAGWVQDGTRLYGLLYGAGPVATLDQNQIFASWLQKKVVFENAYVRWGDVERGFGPTTVRMTLATGDDVETGQFTVYDSDGTTLLYRSPTVTMRAGDVWQYRGP